MASLPAFTPAIVLFGDSLTETWAEGSLAQRLAEHYTRRLDVINRGFAGYNTEWAIPTFKRVFATKTDREQGKAQPVKLVTIWLGANDSVLPGELQHVPLDKYQDNLSTLISFIRDPSSDYYSPETRILMINCPPVIPEKWHQSLLQKLAERGAPPVSEYTRTSEHTKKYADACLAVAAKENVPVIDFYTALVNTAGENDYEHLDSFLSDGLHLTSKGYAVLHKEILNKIASDFPDVEIDKLDMVLPNWADVSEGAKI